jgi:DNA polymerase-4
MPSTRARRLCPDAVFLSGHYDLYSEYSRKLHAVLTSFTPLVEGISLDEAFLDVTGAQRLFGTGTEIGHQIRDRVAAELSLACSVGVATNKLLAKLASKAAKPRAALSGPQPGLGVCVVEPGAELEFLHPLPVSALWGVGPATEARLKRFGVATIGDLAAVPRATLVGSLGQSLGAHLHELAHGRDPRPVEPDRETKSVSHEETYAVDHVDHEPLRVEAVRMADAVATRLRASRLSGRTVTIKVRFGDFTTITRSHTLSSPVDGGPTIARAAVDLLDQVDVSPGVRLFGVGVSNLTEDGARQLSLDDALTATGWDEAVKAVDEVRARFGDRAVGPGTLAGSEGLRTKRQGDTQWGPDE